MDGRGAPTVRQLGAGLSAPGSVVVGPAGPPTWRSPRLRRRRPLPATTTASRAAARHDDPPRAVRLLRHAPRARVVPGAGRRLRRQLGGNTINGPNRVNVYRWPSAPFGHPPDYASGAPVFEEGAERLYLVPHVGRPVVNLGVSVIAATRGSFINPWLLGSPDENDVQGQAATPVNVNALTPDYRLPVGAAATVFPSLKRFWVAVDSSRDEYTGRALRGRYVLRYWVNDLRPPSTSLVTTRVAMGRPTIVVRARDRGAGVNPLSLLSVLSRRNRRGVGLRRLVGPGAVRASPQRSAPRARPDGAARRGLRLPGVEEREHLRAEHHAEHPFPVRRDRVVRGTTINWLLPERGACVRGRVPLLVVAGSTRRISSVRFFDGLRRIGADRRGSAGLYSATWAAQRARRGRHVLRAVVTTRGGRRARRKPPRARLQVNLPRVAVVTGGATGIGAALAQRLAGEGWTCVLLGRREDPLRRLADEIGGEYEVCDVADREAVERVAASVRERHPAVALLVNNAGIPGRSNFLDVDPEKAEQLVRINYLGSLWSARAFLPALEASGTPDRQRRLRRGNGGGWAYWRRSTHNSRSPGRWPPS